MSTTPVVEANFSTLIVGCKNLQVVAAKEITICRPSNLVIVGIFPQASGHSCHENGTHQRNEKQFHPEK